MPEGDAMDPAIDLVADLNAEDDEALGWSVLSEARDPSRVRRGVVLVAGNDQAKAVAQVVAVDEDGQVHFTVLRRLLEREAEELTPEEAADQAREIASRSRVSAADVTDAVAAVRVERG
jgi:pyruvate-formate lyase-activating enzyme